MAKETRDELRSSLRNRYDVPDYISEAEILRRFRKINIDYDNIVFIKNGLFFIKRTPTQRIETDFLQFLKAKNNLVVKGMKVIESELRKVFDDHEFSEITNELKEPIIQKYKYSWKNNFENIFIPLLAYMGEHLDQFERGENTPGAHNETWRELVENAKRDEMVIAEIQQALAEIRKVLPILSSAQTPNKTGKEISLYEAKQKLERLKKGQTRTERATEILSKYSIKGKPGYTVAKLVNVKSKDDYNSRPSSGK